MCNYHNIQLDGFPQTKLTHVLSIQTKRQNIACTQKAPRAPAWASPHPPQDNHPPDP